jgi:DNA (cytosine-5)-methyltransferase 1
VNVLSLFAGIGGLELGLERAGMTVVGQVEIDPFCRRVLAKHWPDVPRHDDVRTCVEWWRSGPRPAVHVVAGGFPCQGHSVAGLRRGTGDERWGWPWYRTVVEALRPAWVIVENVPNLVRTGLLDVLRDLADLGFDAWWGCVPAAAVGAPHLRWRLFVIAADAGRDQLRHQPGWIGGADGDGPTIVGHDGATWALADPGRERRRQGPWQLGGLGSAQRRPAVAYTDGARLEGPRELHDPRPDAGAVSADGGWWSAEPDVGRVAHGVPARVDRLRALGNAVVPQVAQHIGRLVMAAAS